VTVLSETPAWFEFAACKGMDPALFYPEYRPSSDVFRICESCPAQSACREHGLKHEDDGIWGGLGPRERRKIRRDSRFQKARNVRKCGGCSTLFVAINSRHWYCCHRCQVRGWGRKGAVS